MIKRILYLICCIPVGALVFVSMFPGLIAMILTAVFSYVKSGEVTMLDPDSVFWAPRILDNLFWGKSKRLK